jgi:hypothetical protein
MPTNMPCRCACAVILRIAPLADGRHVQVKIIDGADRYFSSVIFHRLRNSQEYFLRASRLFADSQGIPLRVADEGLTYWFDKLDYPFHRHLNSSIT